MIQSVQAREMQERLALRWPPVALAFRPEAPAGLPRLAAAAPSGCTFWKMAAEGKAFYTEATDHFGCPVGSYTHGIPLPPVQAKELEGLVGTMIGLGYLRAEEITALPHLAAAFGVALYAPLADAPFEADLVLVRGTPRQMMLLVEAAGSARVAQAAGSMGRPTCAMLPAALGAEGWATSLGCIGNRVYTDLDDGEEYFVVAASKAPALVEALRGIARANAALEQFHRARRDSARPA